MARITATSDPTLWGQLNTRWLADDKPKIVNIGPDYYESAMLTTGDIVFDTITQQSLYDSRSIKGSKPSSYKKLDDG